MNFGKNLFKYGREYDIIITYKIVFLNMEE